jgi:hypothetical protein
MATRVEERVEVRVEERAEQEGGSVSSETGELDSEVTIYVDGAPVGGAEHVGIDSSNNQVALDGLDPLANVFFSSLVGPAGTQGTAVGEVSVHDRPANRWLHAPKASVLDFSSGTQHVVLIAERVAEGPRGP